MIKRLAQGHPRSMRQSQKHSLALLNLKGLSFFKSLPLMDLGRGSVKSHPAFLQHSVHIHSELSSRGVQCWASLASAWVLGQFGWGCHVGVKPRLWIFLKFIHCSSLQLTPPDKGKQLLFWKLEGKGTSLSACIQSYLAPFPSLLTKFIVYM